MEWGEFSKHDNGCRAFARGWGEGDNGCNKCASTSQDYQCCDMNDCVDLCTEMYRNFNAEIERCVKGCSFYDAAAGNGACVASLRAPSPIWVSRDPRDAAYLPTHETRDAR